MTSSSSHTADPTAQAPPTRKPNVIMGLLSIWQIVSVALVGGSLFGFGIAMAPIYDTLTKDILDCARYSSASSCPVSTGYCVLVNNACTFPHKDLCRVSNTGQPLTYAQCMAVDAGLGGLVSSDAISATVPYRYYSSCQWVSNICTATNEIPSGRLGMIGSILTIGAFAGASVGSQLLHRLGHKRTALLAAVVCFMAAVVTHIQPFGYISMVAMRFIFGVACGVICVVAPTYVDIQAPPSLQNVAGCMFQISITLGIAITAILGYILSDTDGVVTLTTLQGFLAFSTMLCVLLASVSVFCMRATKSAAAMVEEIRSDVVDGEDAADTVSAISGMQPPHEMGPITVGIREATSSSGGGGGDLEVMMSKATTSSQPPNISSLAIGEPGNIGFRGDHNLNQQHVPSSYDDDHIHHHHYDHLKSVSISSDTAILPTTLPPSMASTFWSFDNPLVKQAFVTVTVLILVMQFTGINAIMNYAPRIAKSMGVSPMLGNAVIMSWNFVTTLAAVPLASKLPLRKLYLLGLIAASVGCGISSLGSCLTGSHGGVTALTSFISCIGIALFITGFETGMAPAGFVLVQRAYPSHLTGEAMGYYNAGQNLSAFFIVGLFPVLSDLLSGMFYAAMSPATTAVSTDSGSTIAPSSASTTADTALEAATAFASCVLFGVFSIVGVVGWYVLKKRLP